MKAAVCIKNLVQIKDVELPVPAENEVLVRVRATTICAADYRMKNWYVLRSILNLGKRTPSILGMELSGTVAAVGKAVTKFHVGDEVFGATGFKMRAHAEYVCPREAALETRPV